VIKFFPYVLRSAWRNRLRTVLTVLGVAVAVFLVTGLAAILDSRTRTIEAASQSVLLVNEKDVW
jgi:cell division protein FtsX